MVWKRLDDGSSRRVWTGYVCLGRRLRRSSRLKRVYRYHFVLKAAQRQALGATLRAMLAFAETQDIARRNLVVDVDAVHLM